MTDIPENQIESWLKKLERESWQLELLVSAFTIFLLIGANSAYKEFLHSLSYEYNMGTPAFGIAGLFLMIIKNSIQALTIALIIHLMLRGFWIGTIGLRSVQPTVDFEKLKYNKFFTEKLKMNGVISLDKMVVQLDEICSVIFAFSFLIISVLIAFAMYLMGLGLIGVVLSWFINVSSGTIATIFIVLSVIVALVYIIMGLIYMLDYLTLGFFKKISWFSKIYYPFYRLFNFITLSRLSKSIYYYLISKFSKNRIRIVFTVLGCIVLFMFLFEYDQNRYFPEAENTLTISADMYDDVRSADDYIETISIPSQFIDKPFFPLFLRYNPGDNSIIQGNCPDFEPLKEDGLNSTMGIKTGKGGFHITSKDYSVEDFEQLLACQSSIYQIMVNDSIYENLTFRFYAHPHKDQKGLLTVIPTEGFKSGENVLQIRKVHLDSLGDAKINKYVTVPFWFKPS
ncbi:hypothetical protein [Ekhidna sp.]|uniref:hypothetical protein n=1 Tax=Ekhidna sp. TaxID=2608089 RepID=UPI0032982B5C